jgi:3-oxoacyl-[acyl-carrier protein] reductase
VSARGGNGRLDGRVAIVTGASRGIGRATALLFRAEGAVVIGWDLSWQEPPGPGDAEDLRAEVDLRDAAAVRFEADRVLDAAGRVDILVNNAGVTRGFVPAESLTPPAWDLILDTNARGALHAVQAVVPAMKARGYGRILNVSSVLARHGFPGQTAYAASKAAIEAMTRVWARELGPWGITVNAVAPGYVRTAMNEANGPEVERQVRERTPLGRLGESEDVAHAFLFLASAEASFVTGAVLPVDGGFSP